MSDSHQLTNPETLILEVERFEHFPAGAERILLRLDGRYTLRPGRRVLKAALYVDDGLALECHHPLPDPFDGDEGVWLWRASYAVPSSYLSDRTRFALEAQPGVLLGLEQPISGRAAEYLPQSAREAIPFARRHAAALAIIVAVAVSPAPLLATGSDALRVRRADGTTLHLPSGVRDVPVSYDHAPSRGDSQGQKPSGHSDAQKGGHVTSASKPSHPTGKSSHGKPSSSNKGNGASATGQSHAAAATGSAAQGRSAQPAKHTHSSGPSHSSQVQSAPDGVNLGAPALATGPGLVVESTRSALEPLLVAGTPAPPQHPAAFEPLELAGSPPPAQHAAPLEPLDLAGTPPTPHRAPPLERLDLALSPAEHVPPLEPLGAAALVRAGDSSPLQSLRRLASAGGGTSESTDHSTGSKPSAPSPSDSQVEHSASAPPAPAKQGPAKTSGQQVVASRSRPLAKQPQSLAREPAAAPSAPVHSAAEPAPVESGAKAALGDTQVVTHATRVAKARVHKGKPTNSGSDSAPAGPGATDTHVTPNAPSAQANGTSGNGQPSATSSSGSGEQPTAQSGHGQPRTKVLPPKPKPKPKPQPQPSAHKQQPKPTPAPAHPAPAPSTSSSLPSLPSAIANAGTNPFNALPGPLNPTTVPNFVIDSFQIPPFLLPIYQAAGVQYGIRWEVLAAINEIETNYGRDLSVSSAGALGWMQFMPSTWATYGVDANRDGKRDPYNPVDAIFAAARYLKAAGGDTNVRGAVFAYNHASWYVDSVMLRAQLIAAYPPPLMNALIGLTQGRFPIAGPSRYPGMAGKSSHTVSSGQNAANVVSSDPNSNGIDIYSKPGAPVVAVGDGVIKDIGHNSRDGNYVVLQDAYGNQYTYSRLGSLAKEYAVPKIDVLPTNQDVSAGSAGPAPTGPATQGGQGGSSQGGSSQSGGSASKGGTWKPAHQPPVVYKQRLFAHPDRPNAQVAGGAAQMLSEGGGGFETFDGYFADAFGLNSSNAVLRPLRKGAQVVGTTVLGRVGKSSDGTSPHIHFQIRPAGKGAPQIDPRPILDGWRLLESTDIYNSNGKDAHGKNAGSLTIGELMLLPKPLLEQHVLSDKRIKIYPAGQEDIRTGQIDRRILEVLEYLAAEGYHPTVSALKAGQGAADGASGVGVDISEINGTPVAGHQQKGGIVEQAVRKLMALQGTLQPYQIVSQLDLGQDTIGKQSQGNSVHVGFQPLFGQNGKLGQAAFAALKPNEWKALAARLGQLGNPAVPTTPSQYALPDG